MKNPTTLRLKMFGLGHFRQQLATEKSTVNQCRADYCLKFETKNTQPSYNFNRENPQNSETQNGLRRGLDFIALILYKLHSETFLWNRI